MFILRIISLILISCIAGCTSIKTIGNLDEGSKTLKVYAITHDDFISSSRMLVITDAKGKIAAYSGGTVAGLGAVGLQAGATLATAGAIYYGAKAMQQGVQHGTANVNVKGIPTNANLNIKAAGDLHFH
jgi:hypothetical protein